MEQQTKYDRAKKKVDFIKGFYNHLIAYLVINAVILLSRANGIPMISINSNRDNLINWLDWNTYFLVIFWGLGLCIHGVYVFRDKFTFIKNWEQKKLDKLLEDEEKEQNARWN